MMVERLPYTIFQNRGFFSGILIYGLTLRALFDPARLWFDPARLPGNEGICL